MSGSSVATNKQAKRNYEILETYEAGIVLKGSEVKSLRDAQARIDEGFCRFENGELWLLGVYIAPFKQQSTHYDLEPDRNRKLLLNRGELQKLRAKADQQGLTIVPMKIYFTRGKAKVKIGLGKGKKLHDKRRDMAKRDAQRDINQELGRRNKGI